MTWGKKEGGKEDYSLLKANFAKGLKAESDPVLESRCQSSGNTEEPTEVHHGHAVNKVRAVENSPGQM